MADPRPARWRNIWIFAALVLGLGTLGGLNYFALDGLGGLLFILSPLLVTLAMRLFAGDGWGDVVWRPRLVRDARTYLAALVLFPTLFAVTLGLGVLFGAVAFQPGWPAALVAAILAGAPAILFFAFSEEFAWRGYLDPRLAALGLADLPRHALVAVIWGLWHVGYILTLPHYTPLPWAVFFPLFALAIFAMTVIYGAWRARTGTFWPAVLAHGVANTLAWPLLNPDIVSLTRPLLFSARPEALVVLAGLCVTAMILLRRGV